jgi:hypothetical protein
MEIDTLNRGDLVLVDSRHPASSGLGVHGLHLVDEVWPEADTVFVYDLLGNPRARIASRDIVSHYPAAYHQPALMREIDQEVREALDAQRDARTRGAK